MQTGLVTALARAALRLDPRAILKSVEELRDAERSRKRNGGIAAVLDDELKVSPLAARRVWLQHSHSGQRYVTTADPRLELEELWLDPYVRRTADEIAEEQAATIELAAAGLAPRSRILLTGPPGNGKTSLAEALAKKLETVLHVVSYANLIGSMLGESSGRLKQLFEYVASGPCVTLFDEFEGLAKERNDQQETGEMKRISGSLLTSLERLPPFAVIVAATNHPEMLDRATRRRFDAHLQLNAPGAEQVRSYAKARLDDSFGAAAQGIAGRLADMLPERSYAEAALACDDLLRRRTIEPTTDAATLAERRLQLWAEHRQTARTEEP